MRPIRGLPDPCEPGGKEGAPVLGEPPRAGIDHLRLTTRRRVGRGRGNLAFVVGFWQDVEAVKVDVGDWYLNADEGPALPPWVLSLWVRVSIKGYMHLLNDLGSIPLSLKSVRPCAVHMLM